MNYYEGAGIVKVKIRKGDTVEIISGLFEDKGKRGEVIKVLPKDSRIVVQGAVSDGHRYTVLFRRGAVSVGNVAG